MNIHQTIDVFAQGSQQNPLRCLVLCVIGTTPVWKRKSYDCEWYNDNLVSFSLLTRMHCLAIRPSVPWFEPEIEPCFLLPVVAATGIQVNGPPWVFD